MKQIINRSPLLLILLLTGCALGPDYQRPSFSLPSQFKEAKGFKIATPGDEKPKGDWWQIYHDPMLNSLMQQVILSNQNIALYAANYRQALALVGGDKSDFFPKISANANATRSSNHAESGSPIQRSYANAYSSGLTTSWQFDLWGKLRRQLAEDKANAQASAAELANATLSAQAELAKDYFKLRILDERIALYKTSLTVYSENLRIITNRYQAGSDSRATLAQAQMQLASTKASTFDIHWQRAQLEHAIALLLGKTPATFSLAAAPLQAKMPQIPSLIPTDLLQRRPDIAQAERKMAAANEAIGVAVAGYFPDLSLDASAGLSASVLHDLIALPMRVWSIAPKLSGNVLDFGATSAKVSQARAAWDAQVASYRQTVLDAMREVEDNLVELDTLAQELIVRKQSAEAAAISARVTRNQYEAGMIDYLDVVSTENSRLSEQQSVLALESSQWVTSISLITALGGGWHTDVLGPTTQ